MNELKQKFEESLQKALIDLAMRAKKMNSAIEKFIEQDILDDSIDEFFIEFDSFERPIFYLLLGESGLGQWQNVVKFAPKIYYTIPSKTRKDDTCYFLDYGDGIKHWCYMDECALEIERTCSQFSDIVYCHRFIFTANLHCVKFTEDSKA